MSEDRIPPHGIVHDGTAIGNCTSGECQIRGRCTYPTACRRTGHLITDARTVAFALRLSDLSHPDAVRESSAMADDLLRLRAMERRLLGWAAELDFSSGARIDPRFAYLLRERMKGVRRP